MSKHEVFSWRQCRAGSRAGEVVPGKVGCLRVRGLGDGWAELQIMVRVVGGEMDGFEKSTRGTLPYFGPLYGPPKVEP